MSNVLIAEDNVMIADILEEFVVIGGHSVCGIARTVDEAVTLADLHQPDIAIIDYRLADGGFGSQISPLLAHKRTMAILYASGDSLNHDLIQADGEGYIQKPYMMADLLKALRIVSEIKTNHASAPELFPHNFHLLKNVVNEYRSPMI